MTTILGQIISDKMKNTVVVSVERTRAHPMYHKRIRYTKKVHALNTDGAKLGDWVRLSPIRPISKLTFWKVIEVVKKHGAA